MLIFARLFRLCDKNDIQTHYKMKQKNLQWQVIIQLKLGVSS